MKIYKIKRHFYNQIKQGNKTIEIRKLDALNNLYNDQKINLQVIGDETIHTYQINKIEVKHKDLILDRLFKEKKNYEYKFVKKYLQYSTWAVEIYLGKEIWNDSKKKTS